MDDKHDKKGIATTRVKRMKVMEPDESWDCSVCTFKNSAEAFKCEMCDARKGTSTRKPRAVNLAVAPKVQSAALKKDRKKEKRTERKPRNGGLGYVDRSSGQSMEVTVNDVTVIITDYKFKEKSEESCMSSPGSVISDNFDSNASSVKSETEVEADPTENDI